MKKLFVALVIIYALICGMSLGYGLPHNDRVPNCNTTISAQLVTDSK